MKGHTTKPSTATRIVTAVIYFLDGNRSRMSPALWDRFDNRMAAHLKGKLEQYNNDVVVWYCYLDGENKEIVTEFIVDNYGRI